MEETSNCMIGLYGDIEEKLSDVAKGTRLLSANFTNDMMELSIIEKRIRNLYYDDEKIQFTVEPDIDVSIRKTIKKILDLSDGYDFGYLVQDGSSEISVFFTDTRQ